MGLMAPAIPRLSTKEGKAQQAGFAKQQDRHYDLVRQALMEHGYGVGYIKVTPLDFLLPQTRRRVWIHAEFGASPEDMAQWASMLNGMRSQSQASLAGLLNLEEPAR